MEKLRSFFKKYVSENISFYSMEIMMCAVLVIGGLFWAIDVFRIGFWGQGVVFLLNSIVGGFFLVKFSLRRKVPLFYVSMILMVLVVCVNVNSLPERERILLNWQ